MLLELAAGAGLLYLLGKGKKATAAETPGGPTDAGITPHGSGGGGGGSDSTTAAPTHPGADAAAVGTDASVVGDTPSFGPSPLVTQAARFAARGGIFRPPAAIPVFSRTAAPPIPGAFPAEAIPGAFSAPSAPSVAPSLFSTAAFIPSISTAAAISAPRVASAPAIFSAPRIAAPTLRGLGNLTYHSRRKSKWIR